MLEGGDLPRLRDVMATLLEEEVPVSEVEAICASVLDDLAHGSHVLDALARVRSLPALRSKYAAGRDNCALFQLEPDTAEEIAQGIVLGPDTACLVIEPDPMKAITAALRQAIGSRRDAVLVVEDASVRRAIRKLVELDFPGLAVLARQELPPNLRMRPRTTVHVD